nr:MAG TPA: hypothetical protein [Caudoviricetes sp.]
MLTSIQRKDLCSMIMLLWHTPIFTLAFTSPATFRNSQVTSQRGYHLNSC